MSFYGRMASTASRLLTQYGKPIVLERITSVFNPVTGNDTSRTVAESTTIGVEIPIRDALVDGTRVKVGDRFFIIDSSFAPAMGDRLQDAPSSSVSCAYPFTMTNAQAVSLGFDGVLPVVGQTATYTVRGQLANEEMFVSTNAAFQVVDFNSGKKVIEVAFLSTPTQSQGTMAQIVVSVINPNNLLPVASLGFAIGPNQPTLLVSASGTNLYLGTTTQSTIAGIIIDADAGTISAKVNDEVLTLPSNTFPPGNYIIAVQAAESTGGPLEDAGLTLTAEVRTSASDMTQAYPSGTTDICGNQIGYPQISQSWAIVAIEPISPAGVPVAYRLQVRK